MACNCNSTPCGCRVTVCCTPPVESVEYTFENGNLIGIGVFDNDTDNLVQFRGIVSNSASLTVTLDAGNNVIVLDFDDAALVADIPDATTTQRGILETATNAEALAKAATDKILTPSNLAALGGTTTFAGLLELATDAETIAGVSTTLAVTPAGLAAAVDLNGTVVFSDAVTRVATSPSFVGQFGGQTDNNTAWLAFDTGGNAWLQIPSSNADFVITAGANITWSVDSASLTIDGSSGTGSLDFSNFLALSFSTPVEFADLVEISSNIDFQSTGRIFDAGVIVPSNSVLITGSTAGQLSSSLVATFVSTANVQTGYTNFANPAVLRTCDTATVTLPQLAQIVGTLINDLKAVQLPAT